MIYNAKKVKELYNKVADDENEAELNKSLRTEIPREFVKKYLKKEDIVLDAGGGTGINSILMAKKCKSVTLLDISDEILKHASINVRKAKLNNIKIVQSDISNLEQFKNEEFSFLLCVGDSISYVIENRFKAMKELVRVTKKGSILIIGCDSKYGIMRNGLAEGKLNEVVKINKTQITRCGMGPKTYVYEIGEMKKLIEDNDCEVLEIASTPTITDTVDRKQFYGQWSKLKKLELEICTKPELLGIGNHLLFIARKR